jgi:hypothetical protein
MTIQTKPIIIEQDIIYRGKVIFEGKVGFLRGIAIKMINPSDWAIRITAASEEHYPHIGWFNRLGQFMYSIVAHEKAHGGKSHYHATQYFAKEGVANGREGKIDTQFNKDNSTSSYESATVFIKKDSRLVMRDAVTGKPQEIVISNGVLSIREVDLGELLEAGLPPVLENTDM